VWLVAAGCAVSKKTVVQPSQVPAALQVSSKPELVEKFNQQASAIRSINASVKMKLIGGSNYSGVIEQYHEINGFMLASKPANIRVIGQAPVVGKNIFDMVSNGEEFRVFIPSKKDFLVGPANLQRPSKKPIENLRPQHLVDALLWTPINANAPVLFEEENEPQSRFYVLTVLRAPSKPAAGEWESARKIWFNRADLNVSRIETYAEEGVLTSDVAYNNWDAFGDSRYARQLNVSRPGDDYQLQITVTKATFNEPISADRFILPQPPGTELVHVGEEPKEAQP
jgi:outer membrane lipoprotein-sorting protein